MKYIVREPGKSGGAEYDRPDDAIDAAVDWQVETGIACEIWMRWLMPVLDARGHVVKELLSVPHTMEAREVAAYELYNSLTDYERKFDAIA